MPPRRNKSPVTRSTERASVPASISDGQQLRGANARRRSRAKDTRRPRAPSPRLAASTSMARCPAAEATPAGPSRRLVQSISEEAGLRAGNGSGQTRRSERDARRGCRAHCRRSGRRHRRWSPRSAAARNLESSSSSLWSRSRGPPRRAQ